MNVSRQFATLGFLIAFSAAAFAQSMPAGVTVSNGMLRDSRGMTLYTFDNDKTPGQSACNGGCLANWPALIAAADAKPMGDWTVITRNDGAKQWAYKGKPLYTYAKDAKPGDMVGENMGNVWHMAKS